jgi:hypothetical protein
MSDYISNEVVELHRFFEAWLTGVLDKTREEYQRFENAMAEDFVMVPPDSNVLPRHVIMDTFWGEHGSKASPFGIKIRNLVARPLPGSLYLVSYEEWQFTPQESARISTAVMQESDSGIRWLSVHESWLPELGPKPC